MEISSATSLTQMHSITSLVSSSSNLNHSPSFEDDNVVQCPTCDTKLHRYEVANHCEEEMQRLKELQGHAHAEISTQTDNKSRSTDEAGHSTSNDQSSSEKRKPWSVFQRVQRNRQSRMKQRNRKRPAEHSCPVCNQQFSPDEIQQHAEDCLRRSRRTTNGRRNSDEHSSNDDENAGGEEEYEEYEWAGQKRIRVSSLLQGGYVALGIGQPLTNGSSSSSNGSQRVNRHDEDDDEDLNVDEDDTQIYGPAQYGESDVIPSHVINEDENDITSYMRRLITGSTSSQIMTNFKSTNGNLSPQQHNINCSNETAVATPTLTCSAETKTETASQYSTPAHYQQIIDSLKARLRHYEQKHVPGKYKCLICLDDYRNPAISVACWHVHCEQCWLRSLGARKLCPQCNLITTPKDLRRIFM